MSELRCIRVNAIPSNSDNLLLLSAFLNSKFMVLHDISAGHTSIITDSPDVSTAMHNFGISMDESDYGWTEGSAKRFKVFATYLFEDNTLPYKKVDSVQESRLSDLYVILNGTGAKIITAFCPSEIISTNRIKKEIEKDISEMEVRATRNSRPILENRDYSAQVEIYHDSDKKRVLGSALNMLNDIIMSNGTSYKFYVLIDMSAGAEEAEKYIKSKLLILEESEITAKSMPELYANIEKVNCIPFSTERCSRLLSFSDRTRKLPAIKTSFNASEEGIVVGSYVQNGIKSTDERLCIMKESLNLGAMISGLPGSGKTLSAKSIIGQVAKEGDTRIVIISPNDEWDGFGRSNGLEVIRIYNSQKPINFFRCDSTINAERFYEDLSMLIASASNAGPYRNSIEKVLLSAFNKSYKDTKDPDPNTVYANIELAVIEQHAKVTNTSVKYTKHGENIKAALQNLRLIISRPEFAYNNGIDFRSIIEKGAVFDLSNVSNNMKPFFYALILNQVYSFAESFDIYGDNKLRMLICLEEAQVVFSNDIESAANQDLENRVQNFRKKGIGLFLITHNATDISPRIRRLLQFKMYFRQSADVAKYASNDLIFNEAEDTEIVKKMKVLGQRVCAVSYIGMDGKRKVPETSVFVEVPEVIEEELHQESEISESSSRLSDTRFIIKNKEGAALEGIKMQLLYLGERIAESISDKEGSAVFTGMLVDKIYELAVLGEKKKDTKRFSVYGGKNQELTI